MSKKCSWCDYDMVEEKAWRCPNCDELVEIKDTVFHRITASLETLAETYMFNYDGKEFKSLLLPNMVFNSREEAYTATVARLKEVEK